MKKIFVILIALIGFGISVNAQPGSGNTYIEETPTVLKCKKVMINDPRGHLCDLGAWSKVFVVRKELVKKSTGEKWVRKRLIGYLSCNTGSKLNTFSDSEYQYYSRELNLNGKFSEAECYDCSERDCY